MSTHRSFVLSATLATLSLFAAGCSQSRQYVWGGSLGPVSGSTEIPLEILGETSGTATTTVYTLFGFIKWTSGDNLVGINGGGLYGFGFTLPFVGSLMGPRADDMAVDGAKYRAIEAVPRACGLVDTHIKVDKEWFDILIFSRTTATATARGVAYGVKPGPWNVKAQVPLQAEAAPGPAEEAAPASPPPRPAQQAPAQRPAAPQSRPAAQQPQAQPRPATPPAR